MKMGEREKGEFGKEFHNPGYPYRTSNKRRKEKLIIAMMMTKKKTKIGYNSCLFVFYFFCYVHILNDLLWKKIWMSCFIFFVCLFALFPIVYLA